MTMLCGFNMIALNWNRTIEIKLLEYNTFNVAQFE